MGRGYTFTCHTCKIVYAVGYGSYGHMCLEPDEYSKESIGEYKRRLSALPLSEQRMAIAHHYAMVMTIHSQHEWDALDSEFSECEEGYDERRTDYFRYDFQDAWRVRTNQAVDVCRRILGVNPLATPSELTRLANAECGADVMDDEWAARIIENSKPKSPLPRELRAKLSRFNKRNRTRRIET